MKLSFSPEDEKFREEVATWLNENLKGQTSNTVTHNRAG